MLIVSSLYVNSSYIIQPLPCLHVYRYDRAGTIHDFFVCMLCGLDQPIMSLHNAASWGFFNTVTKVGSCAHCMSYWYCNFTPISTVSTSVVASGFIFKWSESPITNKLVIWCCHTHIFNYTLWECGLETLLLNASSYLTPFLCCRNGIVRYWKEQGCH